MIPRQTATLILFTVAFVGFNCWPANAWWFYANEPAAAAAAVAETPKPVAPVAVDPAASTINNNNNNRQGQLQTKPVNNEVKAIASFDLDGVKGTFKFAQSSPQEPTRVEYDLSGLQGNNRLYHVHVRPVPHHDHNQMLQQQQGNSSAMIKQMCADHATGGHLNPHNITQKLPPKSAPFDKYELGDLSGKHGPLLLMAGQQDRYVGTYSDDKLPMSGEHSIVGRSIVIHKNDGARWVCASILPVAQ